MLLFLKTSLCLISTENNWKKKKTKETSALLPRPAFLPGEYEVFIVGWVQLVIYSYREYWNTRACEHGSCFSLLRFSSKLARSRLSVCGGERNERENKGDLGRKGVESLFSPKARRHFFHSFFKLAPHHKHPTSESTSRINNSSLPADQLKKDYSTTLIWFL